MFNLLQVDRLPCLINRVIAAAVFMKVIRREETKGDKTKTSCSSAELQSVFCCYFIIVLLCGSASTCFVGRVPPSRSRSSSKSHFSLSGMTSFCLNLALVANVVNRGGNNNTRIGFIKFHFLNCSANIYPSERWLWMSFVAVSCRCLAMAKEDE